MSNPILEKLKPSREFNPFCSDSLFCNIFEIVKNYLNLKMLWNIVSLCRDFIFFLPLHVLPCDCGEGETMAVLFIHYGFFLIFFFFHETTSE